MVSRGWGRGSRVRDAALVTAALILAAAGVGGQVRGDKVSLAYLPSPRPHVKITNDYSSPLVVAVVAISPVYAPREVRETDWYDPAVYFPLDPPVDPGRSFSFTVGSSEAPYVEPHLVAVVFQDGSSAGDEHLLSELHPRRQAAYSEIEAVSELLGQSLAKHDSDTEIVSALKAMSSSLRGGTRDAQRIGGAVWVIHVALRDLERARVAGEVGNPGRTIPAVILPLFSRWRAALKHYDPGVK